ncbi:transmembrane protein 209-like isoform X1 [Clytia hemisphaerica]
MSQTITQRSPTATRTSSFNTTPSKIRRLQHPVVGKSNDVILTSRNAKKSAFWCVVNVVGAILAYVRLFSYFICHVTGWDQSAAVFSYLDFTLALLFSWNALTNIYLYCLPVVNKQNIYLSPLQKRLLGVTKENDHLFQSTPPPAPISSLTPSSAPARRSTTTPTSQVPSYPVRRNTRTPNSSSNISPGRQHSPNRVQSSPVKNYSPGHVNTTPYGQTVHRSSSRDSFYTPNSPMNVSNRGMSFSSTPSPSVFNQSPSFSARNISPGRINSQDEQLLSFTSLDKYIKQEEEARLRRGQDSPQKSSFWKYGSAAYEYIPSFGSYQLATRSQTPNVKDDDDDDGVESLFKQDEMLNKLGFLRADVSIWTENLRKWLAQSVLEPIVLEIDNINKRLTQLGNPELKIGLSSRSTLQTLLATKGQHLPSLATIIPYLSVSTNQEYLVARLKELSTGGCLRLYKWDNGGNYKGKPWNSDLPTDAEIIIHLFCTYLDTHLPSNPRYADGKSFSGLHFIKTPIKPEERKSELCIYQSRTRKPHFKVLLEDQTCELPKGRNNLFVAIVVFLYYAKRNFHGMIERVNLGMSGINLLWILEKQ